jgi:uncharacterized protein
VSPVTPATRLASSRYNHLSDLEGGTSLLFNTFTLSLLALRGRDAARVRRILAEPNRRPRSGDAVSLRRLLLEKGFIIDAEVDERAVLRAQHTRARDGGGAVSLTIAPTLACNFRCTYCYQTRPARTMNKEVEEAVREFVRARLREGRSLFVTWFGGEPLLAMDTVERLSLAFIKMCRQKKARYSASIVTNGYLLDADTVKRLKRLRVREAQVTIDGPPDVHDARRPTASGGSTFSRVLANLKRANGTLKISLRMNLDAANRERVDQMLDILEREGLQRRVGFYVGQVQPYTAACQDVAGSCISDEEFSLLGLRTRMAMAERGFTSTFAYPHGTNCHCVAENGDAVVITPTGGLARCWNEVDDPTAEIGHLLAPRTEAMLEHAARWRERDLFESECGECLLLPMCMGGCPYMPLKSGTLECHPWKPHLDESLLFYYFLRETQRQKEIAGHFVQAVKTLRARGKGRRPMPAKERHLTRGARGRIAESPSKRTPR